MARRSAITILTLLCLTAIADASRIACTQKTILQSTASMMVARSGRSLYVVQTAYDSDEWETWRIDMQDGSATRLPTPSFPHKYVVNVSADDAALYFTADNGLWKAPLDGRPANMLVSNSFAWRFGMTASDGQYLHWVAFGPQSDEIWRMHVRPGESNREIERVATSLSLKSLPGPLVVGTEAIFIRSANGLYRAAKSGGPVTRLFAAEIDSFAVSDRDTLWFTTMTETPVTYRDNRYDVLLWRADPPLYEPKIVAPFSQSSFPFLFTNIVVTTAGGSEHVYIRLLGGSGSAVFPFWGVMVIEESGRSRFVVPTQSGYRSLLGVYEGSLYVGGGYTSTIERLCEPARQRAVRH